MKFCKDCDYYLTNPNNSWVEHKCTHSGAADPVTGEPMQCWTMRHEAPAPGFPPNCGYQAIWFKPKAQTAPNIYTTGVD
jgi:hypothetical protein